MNVLHIILLIVISTLRDPFVNGAINGNADEVAITNTERMALKKVPNIFLSQSVQAVFVWFIINWVNVSK